jgi:phosphoglycolate phosphatase
MPGAVIFDLDGTLLDTIGDLADAANYVLEKNGYPVHTIADYKEMVGDGIRALIQRMLPDAHRTSEKIEELLPALENRYNTAWKNRTVPFAGIPGLLTALEQKSIPMAILSNKPQVFTVEMVYKLLPEWQFDPVWGAADGRPRKPDPAAALDISKKWDLPPSECLFVGDSEPDIHTAKNAGMISVAVSWGFRTRTRLSKERPDYVIGKPMQLLDLL